MRWKWTFRHLHLASTTTHLDPDGLVAHFFLGYANNISEGEGLLRKRRLILSPAQWHRGRIEWVQPRAIAI